MASVYHILSAPLDLDRNLILIFFSFILRNFSKAIFCFYFSKLSNSSLVRFSLVFSPNLIQNFGLCTFFCLPHSPLDCGFILQQMKGANATCLLVGFFCVCECYLLASEQILGTSALKYICSEVFQYNFLELDVWFYMKF